MLNLPGVLNWYRSEKILLCAIGGGYDIFATIPLAYTLAHKGNKVFFSSLSLQTEGSRYPYYTEGGDQEAYQPEAHMAYYLNNVSTDYNFGMVRVNVIKRNAGIDIMAKYYQDLMKEHDITHVITVDAGVDSIMKGDEQRPGTCADEFLSFAALKKVLYGRKMTHVCLGFGTEAEEQVSHGRVLENIAEMSRENAYDGACALTPGSRSFMLYKNAYHWTHKRATKKSHIHTRIIPAVEGMFGMVTAEDGTIMQTKAPVFLSPLMGIYWFFSGYHMIYKNKVVEQIEKDGGTFFQSVQTVNSVPKTRGHLPIPY